MSPGLAIVLLGAGLAALAALGWRRPGALLAVVLASFAIGPQEEHPSACTRLLSRRIMRTTGCPRGLRLAARELPALGPGRRSFNPILRCRLQMGGRHLAGGPAGDGSACRSIRAARAT